ncbi:MAG: hypothetical protein ACLU0O_06370 [Collinsella sp.]
MRAAVAQLLSALFGLGRRGLKQGSRAASTSPTMVEAAVECQNTGTRRAAP